MDDSACAKLTKMVLVPQKITQEIVINTHREHVFTQYIAKNSPFCTLPATKTHLTSSQNLIRDLLHQGYTLTQIAIESGIAKATISRLHHASIRHTSDKTFSKLLGLYCYVYYHSDKSKVGATGGRT